MRRWLNNYQSPFWRALFTELTCSSTLTTLDVLGAAISHINTTIPTRSAFKSAVALSRWRCSARQQPNSVKLLVVSSNGTCVSVWIKDEIGQRVLQKLQEWSITKYINHKQLRRIGLYIQYKTKEIIFQLYSRPWKVTHCHKEVYLTPHQAWPDGIFTCFYFGIINRNHVLFHCGRNSHAVRPHPTCVCLPCNQAAQRSAAV